MLFSSNDEASDIEYLDVGEEGNSNLWKSSFRGLAGDLWGTSSDDADIFLGGWTGAGASKMGITVE